MATEITAEVAERFLAKVDMRGPDDCWHYTAACDANGYGCFHVTKQLVVNAHRVALMIKLGRPIAPGMFSCHDCDNPPCCNPSHLYEGTHQQNVDDKVRRGRQQRGEQVVVSVLTAEQVRDLRERFAAGEYITALSLEFGISLGAASKVINGHTWAHVGGPIRTTGRRGRRSERERLAA